MCVCVCVCGCAFVRVCVGGAWFCVCVCVYTACMDIYVCSIASVHAAVGLYTEALLQNTITNTKHLN